MLSEVDCLCAGMLGGFVASSSIFAIMYMHFSLKFKGYFFNKENFKTRVMVLGMQDEIKSINLQLARLNAEAYNEFVRQEYK